MQHDIFMNCSFSYQKKFIIVLLGIRSKQISFFVSIFRKIFFFIVTVIITERFNIYFSKITWLPATWSFLLGCSPNVISAPLLYHTDFGSKVSQLPPISIILNIFNKCLTPREQRKLILTRFNWENIPSSLASETRAVNNNLIISSTSLHPLLLGAVEILCHVARYKTPARKRVFFVYSTNSYHCYKKIGNWYFHPNFF